MLRRLPLRWSVPTLVLGVALGLGIASRPLSRPAHARSDDKALADAASADRAGSSLIQTSRQLARVAAEVTPSVVHIESKFETSDRRQVEETGSGVIVTSPTVPG
jgi:S1-C subfamily serine protease